MTQTGVSSQYRLCQARHPSISPDHVDLQNWHVTLSYLFVCVPVAVRALVMFSPRMSQQQPQELLLDRILCQAQALDVAIAGGGPIGILTAIAIRRKLKRTIHIFEGAAPGKGAARVSVTCLLLSMNHTSP